MQAFVCWIIQYTTSPHIGPVEWGQSDIHACWALKPWWRHQMETFSALLALCAGNSPVNSPHKGQWRGALRFSFICASINGRVNNHGAGDLRRHRAHYDGIVMRKFDSLNSPWCRIYASVNWVSTVSDNGLAPVRRQAITWTNTDLLSIGPLETNFSEFVSKCKTFHSWKCIWKCCVRTGGLFV